MQMWLHIAQKDEKHSKYVFDKFPCILRCFFSLLLRFLIAWQQAREHCISNAYMLHSLSPRKKRKIKSKTISLSIGSFAFRSLIMNELNTENEWKEKSKLNCFCTWTQWVKNKITCDALAIKKNCIIMTPARFAMLSVLSHSQVHTQYFACFPSP